MQHQAGDDGIELAAFLDPAHRDRFHQPGFHGLLFADAIALAHDPELGEALRQVHRHFADTLAELLRRGRSAGDVRDDIDPHTAARWLVSLLSGAFLPRGRRPRPGRRRGGSVEDGAAVAAAGNYVMYLAGPVAVCSRYSRGPRRK